MTGSDFSKVIFYQMRVIRIFLFGTEMHVDQFNLIKRITLVSTYPISLQIITSKLCSSQICCNSGPTNSSNNLLSFTNSTIKQFKNKTKTSLSVLSLIICLEFFAVTGELKATDLLKGSNNSLYFKMNGCRSMLILPKRKVVIDGGVGAASKIIQTIDSLCEINEVM